MDSITPGSLKQMLDSGEDFVILDARNPVDAAKVWIESDKRKAIALNDLPERYEELPHGKKMVIIDVNGKRSALTASYLSGKGYEDMVKLGGGMMQWVLDGLPTSKAL